MNRESIFRIGKIVPLGGGVGVNKAVEAARFLNSREVEMACGGGVIKNPNVAAKKAMSLNNRDVGEAVGFTIKDSNMAASVAHLENIKGKRRWNAEC